MKKSETNSNPRGGGRSLPTGEGKEEEAEKHLEEKKDKSEQTEEKKLEEAKAESKASGSQSLKEGVILAQEVSQDQDLTIATAREKVRQSTDDNMNHEVAGGVDVSEADHAPERSTNTALVVATMNPNTATAEAAQGGTPGSHNTVANDVEMIIRNNDEEFEEEDARTDKEKADVLKVLEGIVSSYDMRLRSIRMALEDISKVTKATTDERQLYVSKIIGEDGKPEEYGWPFDPDATNTPGDHEESSQGGSEESDLDRKVTNRLLDLTEWFSTRLDKHNKNGPLYHQLIAVGEEIFHNAKIQLDILSNRRKPQVEILSKCKAGYFAELELCQLWNREAILVKNGRGIRELKTKMKAGENARVEEIVTLMMKFPCLSKLHSDMLKAGATVIMRLDMASDSARNNLDGELLGMTAFERQLYIPGYINAVFDLIADVLVEIAAEAIQNDPSGTMTTKQRIRAHEGMTLPEKKQLHKAIRDDQNYVFKLMVGELIGCEPLGCPGDLTSLINQNLMQTVEVEKRRDMFLFVNQDRAKSHYSYGIPTLHRQDFHAVYVVALWGMTQMDYLPGNTKMLAGGRRFVQLVDQVSLRTGTKIPESDIVMRDLSHVVEYAFQAWIGLSDLDPVNVRSPGMITSLKDKLIHSGDYEETIKKVVAIAEGKTCRSSVTGYRISADDGIENERLIPQPEGGNQQKRPGPHGGRGGGGRGGRGYTPHDTQNLRAPQSGPSMQQSIQSYDPNPSARYPNSERPMMHYQLPGYPILDESMTNLSDGYPILPRHGERGALRYGGGAGRERYPHLRGDLKDYQDTSRSISPNSSCVENEDYFRACDDSAHQSDESDLNCCQYGSGPQQLNTGKQPYRSALERKSYRGETSNRAPGEPGMWERIPGNQGNKGNAPGKKNSKSRLGKEPMAQGSRYATLRRDE